MATYRITAPDGGTYEVTAPDEATQEQVLAYAQANYGGQKAPAVAPTPPKRSMGQELVRQVGLTGRHAIEGGAQILDLPGGMIQAGLGAVGVKSDLPSRTAGKFADWLGLPVPETGLERTVGAATRGAVGAAVPAGLASAAAGHATGATRGVMQSLAANPAAQIGGGAGGGAAAEGAKEGGLNELGQMGAGVLGGVAGGLAGNAAMGAAGRLGEALATRAGVKPLPGAMPRAMDDTQLASQLRARLSITGGDWDAIPANVRKSLMADVRKANTLDNLDARALQRLADFRALEVTPTLGTVTLDPVQLTREKNLAKAGASSNLANIQGLAQVENANNNRLVQLLQGLEGGVEVDPLAAGRTLSDSITGRRDALRAAERQAWDAAKQSPGYRMPMQAHVLSDINQALGESAQMPFINKEISAYMQALQANPEQFTPQAYQNLRSMLSNEMAGGGNAAAAARTAANILDGAQLRPAASQFYNPAGLPVTARDAAMMQATNHMPDDAMAAIDRARQATRAAYQYEGSSPLVRSALSDGAGADPARLAQRYIIGGTPDEATEIARQLSPQARGMVRNALATHIKRKALGGAADEVGNVSQKALHSAIRSVGKEKLALFFSPEDIAQLERVGRVASYTQVQPAGAAVNNSNSGALMVGKGIDLLTGVTSKVPLLNINQQVDALVSAGRTGQALQAHRGLLSPVTPEYGLLSNAGRGAMMGGLLAIPKDSESAKDNKRK